MQRQLWSACLHAGQSSSAGGRHNSVRSAWLLGTAERLSALVALCLGHQQSVQATHTVRLAGERSDVVAVLPTSNPAMSRLKTFLTV